MVHELAGIDTIAQQDTDESGPTELECFHSIRRIPLFAGISNRILKRVKKLVIMNSEDSTEQKPKSFEVAKTQIFQATNALANANKKLHEFMTPTLREDLGLDKLDAQFTIMCDRIAKQDTDKYVETRGPLVSIPAECTIVHVEDMDALASMVNQITELLCDKSLNASDFPRPTIYIDLQGYNLGRDRRPQLIQICEPRANVVYLIYLEGLGHAAFTSPCNILGYTLKQILECSEIQKVFYDCRNDIAALFFHHNINLDPSSVIDLQLLACASEPDHKRRVFLRGLGATLSSRFNIPYEQKTAWVGTREECRRIVKEGPQWREKEAAEIKWAEIVFKAAWEMDDLQARLRAQQQIQEGGILLEDGWDEQLAWARRPLPEAMEKSAVGGVIVLPLLHEHFAGSTALTPQRKKAVEEETKRRILCSQAKVPDPNDYKAPEGWEKKEWCMGIEASNDSNGNEAAEDSPLNWTTN